MQLARRSIMQVIFATIISTLLLAACNTGSSSPPAPPATLTSIAVTPQAPNVSLLTGLQLSVIGTYSDGSTQNLTTSVTWSSGNTSVVTVSASTGLAAAVSNATAGNTAVITATSGALKATTTITLVPVTTFDLSNASSVSDPLTLQQWGLLNTGQTGYADNSGVASSNTLGTDINVNPVYKADGYTGKNVIVAVVDSGMEIAHEDLSANVIPNGSWNFINNTTDPTNATATTGDHGTMVAGLIAMAKNGKGGIGVAPDAQLKGFNFLGGGVATAANEIVSLGGSSASPNSSDVAIFNQSFGMANTTNSLMDPTVEAQYASGTSTLRGGKGALYVKSAGNGFNGFAFQTAGGTRYEVDGCDSSGGANASGISCQNANFDPSNTLPYNIVMAALNAKGTKTSYSTAGSAIWASAPGGQTGWNSTAITMAGYIAPATGSTVYDPAMVTTDQSGCAKGESVNTAPTGAGPFSYFNWGGTNAGGVNANCNYTNGMNGTSSAAPMMSGSIALILEANPSLTWREVKDILAKTAVMVDTSNASVVSVLLNSVSYVAEQGWITNAAGFNFSNWYGFGAVNVSAAVNMAKTYSSGSLGTFTDTGWISSGTLSSAIPDNSTTGVPVSLTVPKIGASGIVEAVQILVSTSNISGGYAGDLGIELTSPSGTKSILKNIRDGFSGGAYSIDTSTGAIVYNGGVLSNMVLASNAFYGETSLGTNGTGIWTVKVVDGWAGGTEKLTNVQIRIYGH